MRILLNGEPRDLVGPLSVAALLDQLGLDGRTVAVEVNRKVVKRVLYGTTLIGDASEVEIVAFVGGGSGRGSELS
jgi:thiamine biosynthesis protein ThiS